jgi:hypothetical protein
MVKRREKKYERFIDSAIKYAKGTPAGVLFPCGEVCFCPDERDVGGVIAGWENTNCSRRLFGDLVAFNHQSAKLSRCSEQLARLPLEDLLTHPRSPNVSQFAFPQPVPIPTGSTLCPWKNPLPPTGREHPRFPLWLIFVKEKNRTPQKKGVQLCA